MSPGEKVRAALVADAAVTALVGTRIYPNKMPPSATLPAIVYADVDQVPQNTFTSDPATVLRSARVQVDVYDRDYSTAHDIADAVTDCLHALPASQLQVVELDSRDFHDADLDAERVSRDFSVWCSR